MMNNSDEDKRRQTTAFGMCQKCGLEPRRKYLFTCAACRDEDVVSKKEKPHEQSNNITQTNY